MIAAKRSDLVANSFQTSTWPAGSQSTTITCSGVKTGSLASGQGKQSPAHLRLKLTFTGFFTASATATVVTRSATVTFTVKPQCEVVVKADDVSTISSDQTPCEGPLESSVLQFR